MRLKGSLRKRVLVGAAAVAVAGVAAGCGDSDDGSGGRGGSGGSVRFMTIAELGSGVTNFPDVKAGAQAAVAAINKAGGINGRKIEWSFCDTRADANRAQVCAREAVKERVAAVVGRHDLFAPQSTPILEKGNIPDIGIYSAGSPTDFSSKVSFPLHAGNYGSTAAMPYALKQAGAKKVVFLGLDVPVALAQLETAEAVAKSAGLQSQGIIKVPATATDYGPFVQRAKDSGADGVAVLTGAAGSQAFVKAVKAVGLRAHTVGQISSFGAPEAAAVGEAADGFIVTSPYPDPADTSKPAIKRYNAELDAAGIGEDPVLRRTAGLSAWAAVHAAADVATTIDGDVTSESMMKALSSAQDVDAAGLGTWNPSTLGSSGLGEFARFPTDGTYQLLTFKDGKIVGASLDPVPDPLGPAR